jgi:pentatricopeptide repeat domain-containing protein 1
MNLKSELLLIIVTGWSILDVLCKNQHVNHAIALLTKLKDQDIQPSMCSYNILIIGLCKVGRLKDAQNVFEDLLVKGYNLNVYMHISL